MRDWRRIRGKKVTVHALGVAYRGTVVEMGEKTLVLKGRGGFQEIPWDRISRIEEDTKERNPSHSRSTPGKKGAH